MFRLDIYTGRLNGKYQCDGVVARTPAAALRDSYQDDMAVVDVTSHALNAMTGDDLANLRAVAEELGVHLNERGGAA